MQITEEDRVRAPTKNYEIAIPMHGSCVVKSGSRRYLPINMKRYHIILFKDSFQYKPTTKVNIYVASRSSQLNVSKSRMCTSFSNRLFLSSPPKTISLDPTRDAECPPRASCNINQRCTETNFSYNFRADETYAG